VEPRPLIETGFRLNNIEQNPPGIQRRIFELLESRKSARRQASKLTLGHWLPLCVVPRICRAVSPFSSRKRGNITFMELIRIKGAETNDF